MAIGSATKSRLPFFIRDITDTSVRIPPGDARSHSNGCEGVSRLLLGNRTDSYTERTLAVLQQQTVSFGQQAHTTAAELVNQVNPVLIELRFPEALGVLEMTNSGTPTIGFSKAI